MPEHELANNTEDFPGSSAEQPLRSIDDVAAQRKAELDAVQHEHGAEMTKEARCAQIGEALLTLATTDPDGEKYLTEYLEHATFPDGTNECLLTYEKKKQATDPSYDVTEQSPRRLANVLRRGLQSDHKVTQNAITDTVATTDELAITGSEKSWETISTSADYQNANNADKIAILLSAEGLPEDIKTRVQAFSQILAIADNAPEDAPIIRQKLNQLDFSQGVSDPTAFARAFIFDSPDSQISSGVSEATQNAIAAQLGVVRHPFVAKTGGDVNEIYQSGVGTETYIDEDGEVRERPVYMRPGEDVEIRRGQYIGLSDTNTPVMKIVGEHTYTSNLPENPTDEDMTMYGITTQWVAKLNDVNMSELMFPHSVMERGGGHIELNMPDDFNRAQQLSQIFFGGMAGYNGELLDQSDLDRIPYLMQFQNEKGDAVIGDVNPDQMRADYQRQGVLNKDGALNWDRFGAMIEANRNGLFFSEQNFGQAAQEDVA